MIRRIHNSEEGGIFAFFILICLIILAIWFGYARIRKIWFYRRRNTRFYRAQVTSVSSYRYDNGPHTLSHKRYVVEVSWDDESEGELHASLELGNPLVAWIYKQSGTARIAVVRDRRKPRPIADEPEPEDDPLLPPYLQKELRKMKKLRDSGQRPELYVPEEEIMFRSQRRRIFLGAFLYFVFILIPIMLVPVMILFGWYLRTNGS